MQGRIESRPLQLHMPEPPTVISAPPHLPTSQICPEHDKVRVEHEEWHAEKASTICFATPAFVQLYELLPPEIVTLLAFLPFNPFPNAL